MTAKSRLEALAGHYDNADTTAALEQSMAADDVNGLPAADRMSTFAVRLPLVTLERVREIAANEGDTTSALIRRWIDAGIAADGADTGARVVRVEALLELIGRAPRDDGTR